MYIHFQLTAITPKGSRKGKGKVTARAKMLTSVINQCLSFDQNHIKGFISAHIRGHIPIYYVWAIMNDWAWDLLYDIIFLDPIVTRHFSQFQLMCPHHRSRRPPFSRMAGSLLLIYGANV